MACVAQQCVTSCCGLLLQVLLLLKDVLNPSVRLYLNPQTELSELPLKSFYRYVSMQLPG
jgi:hypothetical protein